MIKVKASLAASEPKVLAGAYLLESDLPTALQKVCLGEVSGHTLGLAAGIRT
jgi:hypothetical protein